MKPTLAPFPPHRPHLSPSLSNAQVLDTQFDQSAQMFRDRLLSQGISIKHTESHTAWKEVPEPDFIARLSYNIKYAPLFLKMIVLAMVFAVTGWAVGVTTSEFELVPKHGSVSIFVGVVVMAAVMGSLAAHIVMYRTRANESNRIYELENKIIDYHDKFAKMLGSSAEDAAQTAAEALGIKIEKPSGKPETLEDVADKAGVSTQTMLAMEALRSAMEEGNIVLLSRCIKRLETTSGFEAPKFAPNMVVKDPSALKPAQSTLLRSKWDEGANDEGDTSAALRSLPRMQLWAAATLHRRLQAIAMAVSRGAPVRDVLHGDNTAANLIVTAPLDSFIPGLLGDADAGGDGGGGGGGGPGILLCDARRIVVEGMDGRGPAAAWLARMPEDAPRDEICDAVLNACEDLIAEVSLSQHALRLAVGSCQRVVAASVDHALVKVSARGYWSRGGTTTTPTTPTVFVSFIFVCVRTVRFAFRNQDDDDDV